MSAFYTLAITIFFAIDALGIIPEYLKLVQQLSRKRQMYVAIRELCIALGIMILFFYFGQVLFFLLGLNRATIQIAGGIVIFLIAIRLIFPREEDHITTSKWKTGEPFIVPIATPLMAGPSVLAMIMIYSQEGQEDYVMLLAIFVAWAVSSIVFLLAKPIYKYVGEKVLSAAQRLMGLVIALVAVQLLLQGIKRIAAGL
jgi:multiple antibiotic resistance protein